MLLLQTGALIAALAGAPSAPVAAERAPADGPRFADVRLATGVRLRYAESGDSAAPALILLHGYSDSWFSWSRVIAPLATRHRVFALDQRGHGDSDRPARGYAMHDLAADVVAFMDAQGIPRAAVVGHSMGSIVAREVVRLAPARVSQLVLVGAASGAPNDAVRALKKDIDALTDPVPSAFAREFQLGTAHRPVPPEFMDRAVAESLKLPASVWRQLMTGIVAAPPARPGGPRIPTLVVWGDRDQVFPRAEQEQLVRAYQPATLAVYAGTGHALHWEEPERFARDVLAFLATRPARAANAAARADSVPLYADLGDHRYVVSTRVPLAQRYFDQGLRLYYAFNHAEAIRAFNEAARLDPRCAMCHWGTALAYGPNINLPMDSAAGVAAHGALQRARAAAVHATPRERALIDALAKRYTPVPRADRAALDSAYAGAMGEVVQRFPTDLEARTLHAEALMDLSPWRYWNADGSPRPDTPVLLAQLERVVRAAPRHPGANHFYIHAVEAVDPARALPMAERLAGLMPGAGHLVHMPGHIYVRVGRYADAIRANEHAVHADESYIRDQKPALGAYTAGYYPHNYDFLAFAASMVGRREQALAAAERMRSLVPAEVLRAPGMTFVQHHQTRHLQLKVRFADWAAILDAPAPAEDLPHARAMWHYARGRALAARGGLPAADSALASVRATATDPRIASQRLEFNTSGEVLGIAAEVLAGHVAAARGDHDAAIRHLREAARREDALAYGEPPEWTVPVRQELGVILLGAGRATDAEQAFREDLKRFPENGWSLRGLQRALAMQGKDGEARAVAVRLQAAQGSNGGTHH
ncbi:alpha/beta fold hydrolase [Roseisolibacter agri]|uniref:Cytochrome c domain-containing protein n=1 Tax=Roseisolibacter agri TaxID=2014610 RepID=A0AA37VE92_9BACT|nr:alpha/beta fold hydrolase [Roseisolibacter agri]GLC24794.1 hypothetical protein rosag_13070 [Roseisolibacter agri]